MLRLRNVGFSYPGAREPHLQEVTLDIPRGAFIGIAGPNGAGKSTLLKLMAGILAPRTGEVLLDDRPVLQFPRRELAARLAWAAQNPSIPASVRLEDFVLAGRFPHLGFFAPVSAEDRDIVGRYLEALDLAPLRNMNILEISGGERQLAVLARALVPRSDYVLLDEPLAHLDPKHHQVLFGVLDREHREGRAILMTSHDYNALRLLADRLLLLKMGRVLAYAPVADIARTSWEALFEVPFQEMKDDASAGGWIFPSMRRD
jgi:iron complex transport system ATP-binding protein